MGTSSTTVEPDPDGPGSDDERRHVPGDDGQGRDDDPDGCRRGPQRPRVGRSHARDPAARCPDARAAPPSATPSPSAHAATEHPRRDDEARSAKGRATSSTDTVVTTRTTWPEDAPRRPRGGHAPRRPPAAVADAPADVTEDPAGQGDVEELGAVAGGDADGIDSSDSQASGHEPPAPRGARGRHGGDASPHGEGPGVRGPKGVQHRTAAQPRDEDAEDRRAAQRSHPAPPRPVDPGLRPSACATPRTGTAHGAQLLLTYGAVGEPVHGSTPRGRASRSRWCTATPSRPSSRSTVRRARYAAPSPAELGPLLAGGADPAVEPLRRQGPVPRVQPPRAQGRGDVGAVGPEPLDRAAEGVAPRAGVRAPDGAALVVVEGSAQDAVEGVGRAELDPAGHRQRHAGPGSRPRRSTARGAPARRRSGCRAVRMR